MLFVEKFVQFVHRFARKIYRFIALRPSPHPSFESLGELNYKATRSYDINKYPAGNLPWNICSVNLGYSRVALPIRNSLL